MARSYARGSRRFRVSGFRIPRVFRTLLLWILVLCLVYWCADHSALVMGLFSVARNLFRDLLHLFLG